MICAAAGGRMEITMKIYELFKKSPFALLAFSLLSGAAYFSILMNIFIIPMSGGKPPLIGWFFSPAIIFGMALVIVKMIKNAIAAESAGKVTAVFILHVIIILLGIVFAVAGV